MPQGAAKLRQALAYRYLWLLARGGVSCPAAGLQTWGTVTANSSWESRSLVLVMTTVPGRYILHHRMPGRVWRCW